MDNNMHRKIPNRLIKYILIFLVIICEINCNLTPSTIQSSSNQKRSINEPTKIYCYNGESVNLNNIFNPENGKMYKLEWLRMNNRQFESLKAGSPANKVGVLIQSDGKITFWNPSSKYTIPKDNLSTLKINPCHFQDEGIYKLSIQNLETGVDAITPTLQLTILQKPSQPTINKQDSWLSGYIKESTNPVHLATCTTTSKPACKHIWVDQDGNEYSKYKIYSNGDQTVKNELDKLGDEIITTKEEETGLATVMTKLFIIPNRNLNAYSFTCQAIFQVEASDIMTQFKNVVPEALEIQYKPDVPTLHYIKPVSKTDKAGKTENVPGKLLCQTLANPAANFSFLFKTPNEILFEKSGKENYLPSKVIDPLFHKLNQFDQNVAIDQTTTEKSYSSISCKVSNIHGQEKVEEIYKTLVNRVDGGNIFKSLIGKVKVWYESSSQYISSHKPYSIICLIGIVVLALTLCACCCYCCMCKDEDDVGANSYEYDTVKIKANDPRNNTYRSDANYSTNRHLIHQDNYGHNNTLNSKTTAESVKRRKRDMKQNFDKEFGDSSDDEYDQRQLLNNRNFDSSNQLNAHLGIRGGIDYIPQNQQNFTPRSNLGSSQQTEPLPSY